MARPGLEPGTPRFSVVPGVLRKRSEWPRSPFRRESRSAGAAPRGRGRVPLGTSRGRPPPSVYASGSTSWVRCICGGFGLVRGGGRSALQRGVGPPRRRRDRARFDLVCPWCARGGLVPHSRRSRLTLPISGGGRRGQGESVRTERSSPRSGLLDAGGRPELSLERDRE